MEKIFYASLMVAAILTGCRSKTTTATDVTPEIPVAEMQVRDVPVVMDFVGQTYGKSDINIVARVSGFLRGTYFEQGASVKRGQLLYVIEPDPVRQQVNEAYASYVSALSSLTDARSNYNRVKPLAAINAVSQSTLDDAVEQFASAQASVNAAQAQLQYARIQLGYTQVRSPIDGVIGRTLARRGDFVGTQSSIPVLNTVSRIDTILVRFYIPGPTYLQLSSEKRLAQLSGIRMQLSDGTYYNHPGKFDFWGRAISPLTGSIDVQVSFANPDSLLRPGQFARVQAVIDTLRNAVLVPQTAIVEQQGVYSVYTVSPQNRILIKNITVGGTYGAMRQVTSGIGSDTRVVTSGFHKLRQGTEIRPAADTTRYQLR